ncbi:MAG: sulfurtransferase TusA family protein, partial [Promethearchaeota archaeon]
MVDIKIDAYNKVCPIPAALTKKAAIKMEKGQTIEIEGDFTLA